MLESRLKGKSRIFRGLVDVHDFEGLAFSKGIPSDGLGFKHGAGLGVGVFGHGAVGWEKGGSLRGCVGF